MIKKNIKLSGEFDEYVSENAAARRRIPNGANIVITSASDESLSAANISIARNSRSGRFVEAHKAGGKWEIRTFER